MDIIELLGSPVVTGGAWGTELQERGLPVGACAEGWNVVRPAVIEEIARAYVDAGSGLLLANTFQANRVALARHGLAGDVGRINRLGIVLTRRAAAHRAFVFGSMGPAGEASGDVREAAFREQAEAFAEANADGIVVETMTTLDEARQAVRAARTTGLRVFASVTCGLASAPDRLSDGEPVLDALMELQDLGAETVGLNCMEASAMLPLCDMLARRLEVPLWMKPNAGIPLVIDGVPRYALTPGEFASRAIRFADAGAALIGGCCGVGSRHVAALAEALEREGRS